MNQKTVPLMWSPRRSLSAFWQGPTAAPTCCDAFTPTVIQEYENLFDSMDIHAGLVMPSTLAALGLFIPPQPIRCFSRLPCVHHNIGLSAGRMQFYRRVVDVSAYEAVYSTLMYYEDKLGGDALGQLVVCATTRMFADRCKSFRRSSA